MYRHFRDEAEQLDAEATAPDRFGDGTDWLQLAKRARYLGHGQVFTANEWSNLTGMDANQIRGNVTASAAWELLPDYTTARLAGKWITIDGLKAINEYKNELFREAPTLRTTSDIRGSRLAIYVIEQATTDPDRRPGFVKLAQANDMLGIAMYREVLPTPEPSWREALRSLRVGTCVPVTEAQRLEWLRSPIDGYYLERYQFPKPGGWHVCRGSKSRIGFAAGW